MSIWKVEPDLERLNAERKGTINDTLDIRFDAYDDSSLTGSIPVNELTQQPYGLLHGGASVVLAETLGSVASYMCIDESRFRCVGMEVNANHLAGVRSGRVTGVARPVHLGRTSHVWDIRLFDEKGRATCISRLTVAVVEIPSSPVTSK